MVIDTRMLAAVLPIAAATIARRRAQAVGDETQAFWRRVHEAAPEPVWQYFCQIDAECQVALECGAQPGWLELHHPAYDDVLEGLARAVHQVDRNKTSHIITGLLLAYVQGWVLQWATARLGMAYALERPGAGVTTSVVYDHEVQARASFELLGWTNRECNQHWADPCAFAERWRTVTRCNGVSVSWLDSDMLGKAGLFDAEVALLDAENNHPAKSEP